MILETNRLIMRPFTQNDFKDLAEILQDPEVMVAYEKDFSDFDVQDWLDKQLTRYQETGLSLYALISKDTQDMVGQCGLTFQPYKETTLLEIGYLLKKRYWHQGYATEAAQTWKEYAFQTLNHKKVYCMIKHNNYASMNVAKRIGMAKENEFIKIYNGKHMLHYLYSISQ